MDSALVRPAFGIARGAIEAICHGPKEQIRQLMAATITRIGSFQAGHLQWNSKR